MSFDRAALDAAASRRVRLGEVLGAQIGDTPALLFAGQAPPRNYAGAPYPFRASSHFLYFVGAALERAVLCIHGGETTLYVVPPSPTDALWIGATLGVEGLSRQLGCPVRPLADLASRCAGAATVPAVDHATRQQQEALLGRAVGDSDADLALADAVIALRLVHDADAIKRLRSAADATTAAHLAGMAATRPGVQEFHVRAAMEGALTARGMGTAYGSIVTVHGEVLHNVQYHNTLEERDLLLADVGAETPLGWAGDVTRTWPVSGEFSSTQRAIYEVVLRAQLESIDAVRPGARYLDVHLTACRALTAGLVDLGILRGDVETLVADGVHALFFPHGVGHLLGLDVHDMEDLGDRAGYGPGRRRSEQFGLSYLRCDRDLEAGMAVTIEPGFYRVPAILEDKTLSDVAGDRLDRAELERFRDVRGIRIEDDILVTDAGHKILTAGIPKSVAEVEACVSG